LPPNFEIPILLKDSEMLAVDKPAGISVHNNEDPENLLTLLSKTQHQLKLFPVHRLDKETSGIQILALNEQAAKTLAEEFQKKSVEKFYAGILRGQLKSQSGIWNQSLTDKSEGRKNPAGMSKDRVPCETRYTVKKFNQYFSFCEFQLITGRQHQIRKHTALANHPLVGDGRYGDPKYNGKMANLYKTERMFLHCQRLNILGRQIESPLPVEFSLLIP
jgi:tRNA pseudouridine65 synthase